jgi:translin
LRKVVGPIQEIAESARAAFALKNQAREAALGRCRDAIRHSANGIRAVHRGEYATATRLIDQAGQLLAEAKSALAGHADIFHAGFVHDAQKEYAEARITLAVVDAANQTMPRPEDLGVEIPAYLNGMSEVVGELRRHLLDSLRAGDIDHSEECLEVMDEIYGVLITFDYPDAMTGGLRRSTDGVRAILERSRGDLTVAAMQSQLEERLQAVQKKLPAN